MSLTRKIAIALFVPLLASTSSISEAAPKPSSLKHNVCADACKPGLYMGPHNKFGVFVFCDDAMGTNIGVVSVGREGQDAPTIDLNWPLDNRFWQEPVWARDVKSFQWSADGNTLFVRTSSIYGTGKLYTLDLLNKTIMSMVDQPKD